MSKKKKDFPFTGWCNGHEVGVEPENCFLGENKKLMVEVQEINHPQAKTRPYYVQLHDISARSEYLEILKKKHRELQLKQKKAEARKKKQFGDCRPIPVA